MPALTLECYFFVFQNTLPNPTQDGPQNLFSKDDRHLKKH